MKSMTKFQKQVQEQTHDYQNCLITLTLILLIAVTRMISALNSVVSRQPHVKVNLVAEALSIQPHARSLSPHSWYSEAFGRPVKEQIRSTKGDSASIALSRAMYLSMTSMQCAKSTWWDCE